MENKPKVSVMFMSYNHAPYLQRAIDGILDQTFQDFEVVFSDDCSSDNTKEIMRSVQDERFKLHFFCENQGATINHRYIANNCVGEYLALINSDDVWLPEHLQKSVDYLDNNPNCGVVFSWADLIDEEDNIIDPCCVVFKQINRNQAEWIHDLFVKGNCLCHPSMVIRREVYEKIGFYKLGFRQLPDFNEWTRILKKYSIYVIPEVLVHHRRRIKTGQNTSAPVVTNSIRDVNESFYTLIHYFDDLSDELFVEAFKSEFRRKNASGDAELKCERFFLMYDEKYYMKPVSRYAAFLYLHDIYNDDDVYEVLKEKYDFDLYDCHMLGTETDWLGLANDRPLSSVVTIEKTRKNIIKSLTLRKKAKAKKIH